jgi:ferritin-like metal-binding protein YciE
MDSRTKSMTGNMADNKLHQFFMEQLQDIYWAEKKLVKVLPKLEEAATSRELKKAFADHLMQTKTHVTRLENVFDMLGENAKARKCPAMSGIIEEGEEIIDETEEGSAQRDVGLIFAAQKAEHYEIATYGGLTQLAKTMGHTEAAEILGQTLAEEKQADQLLSQIAEKSANVQANQEKD